MKVDCFLDTNILVYAAAKQEGDDHKRKRALQLIETENFGISAQVLQEFYVTVTRKLEIPLTPDQALEWMELLETFPCLSIDKTLVKIGVETSLRYQTSYWDGAILAAAKAMGAKKLFSEDLNHNQFYGSVEVCNPFE